jgi:hypothetical protein
MLAYTPSPEPPTRGCTADLLFFHNPSSSPLARSVVEEQRFSCLWDEKHRHCWLVEDEPDRRDSEGRRGGVLAISRVRDFVPVLRYAARAPTVCLALEYIR